MGRLASFTHFRLCYPTKFVAALGVEPSIAPVMNMEHDRRLITVFPFHSTADQVSAL